MRARLFRVLLFVGLLVVLLVVSGHVALDVRRSNYRARLQEKIRRPSVQAAVESWVMGEHMDISSPKYRMGGFLSGRWVAAFDWRQLGFDETSAQVRVLLDAAQKRPVAVYFSENRPFLKVGIVYVIDDKDLDVFLRGSAWIRFGRFGVWDNS